MAPTLLYKPLTCFVPYKTTTQQRGSLARPLHSHWPPRPVPALQAPLAAALLFAAYLAVALLYGVVTFRTVPEEAELLQKVGRQAGSAREATGNVGGTRRCLACGAVGSKRPQASQCQPMLCLPAYPCSSGILFQ